MHTIFPNTVTPSAANAQANAQAFADALWDLLRTLRRVREDESLPGDGVVLTQVGSGTHAPPVAATRWVSPIKHPTLNQWAVQTRARFAFLLDVGNANTAIANRAKVIRAYLCSGPSITTPDGDAIANSFWTTDATTTLQRWNRLAALLALAADLSSDWTPAAP